MLVPTLQPPLLVPTLQRGDAMSWTLRRPSFLRRRKDRIEKTLERPGQGIPPQERGDEQGRRELETIAQNCRRVPAGPPTSFWEACQSIWFSFFFLPDAPGGVDQYLYPFYRARHRGRHPDSRLRQGATLLPLAQVPSKSVGAASGVSAHNHLTLGGVRPDGTDGSNDLTLLCLEVTEELAVLRPQVGVPGTATLRRRWSAARADAQVANGQPRLVQRRADRPRASSASA